MEYVLLQCVKENKKLRVKMISSAPFIKNVNCQFSRKDRIENMYYIVRSEYVNLRRNFYSIINKNAVVYRTFDLDEIKMYITEKINNTAKPSIIFGDDDNSECVICMDSVKDTIFSPCGHFMTCFACSCQCKQCPMCRTNIVVMIKRSDILE